MASIGPGAQAATALNVSTDSPYKRAVKSRPHDGAEVREFPGTPRS
jgi:hypothetical protein